MFEFVAEKLASEAHPASYLQGNFFRLMVAVTRDEPDMEEIERIISVDATLTYALLRVANSMNYATRNRTTSVQQAIMKLGLEQLKQWIYLLSATNSNNEIDPFFEEFLKLSFTRANLCSELMNYTKLVPLNKNEAYLLGMFSTLGYLIDAPLEEILEEVPVSTEIKRALITREGLCGALYELVLSYENAEWEAVNYFSDQLRIPPNLLTNLYFECMETANQVWESINEMGAQM